MGNGNGLVSLWGSLGNGLKTKRIRWVCGKCITVVRKSLYYVRTEGHPGYYGEVRLKMPYHCGVPMLLAGEPKKDVHGLRFKGCMIDPVDNLRLPSGNAIDEWNDDEDA